MVDMCCGIDWITKSTMNPAIDVYRIELRSAVNSNVTVANDTDAMIMPIAVTNTMAMAMMLAIMTMVMQQYTTTTHDNEQQLCQRDPNYDFHNIGYIIFRLGSFAWELALGNFPLGT